MSKKKNTCIEETHIAAYGVRSVQSLGRKYKEQEHPYRSVFQRDRDRIIHSTAFRCLEYKTQVFVNHEGDYYRTRLTHTLEVAQIAKTIAKYLHLNDDLTEAIALAHDLGHTPFGHSGEEILHVIMKDFGGFNHNFQSLRVVDKLEERYPSFRGLNLTFEVREGLAKHITAFDQPIKNKEFSPKDMPSLEAQIVDVADEIAYDNHDLDDGLTSGLIDVSDLRKIPIWNKAEKAVTEKFGTMEKNIKKYQIIRFLINLQVTDLISEAQKNIKKARFKSVQDVRKARARAVIFSKEMQEQRLILRDFLFSNLYNHYRVARMSNKAKRFVKELFDVYLANPEQLPPAQQKSIVAEGAQRAICDYIAGMTDRYALNEYKKLFDPYEKV